MSVQVAIDLGASSGRVILGRVDPRGVQLQEVHRFVNGPMRLPSGLHWNVLGLYRAILDGIRVAGRMGHVTQSAMACSSPSGHFSAIPSTTVTTARAPSSSRS